jgi:hypothetical protein
VPNSNGCHLTSRKSREAQPRPHQKGSTSTNQTRARHYMNGHHLLRARRQIPRPRPRGRRQHEKRKHTHYTSQALQARLHRCSTRNARPRKGPTAGSPTVSTGMLSWLGMSPFIFFDQKSRSSGSGCCCRAPGNRSAGDIGSIHHCLVIRTVRSAHSGTRKNAWDEQECGKDGLGRDI